MLDLKSALTRTDMFEELSPTQLELVISIGSVDQYGSGSILFQENDASDDLYVILRGEVDILVNPGLVGVEREVESVPIATLKAGQILGEVALVDRGLRSATARIGNNGADLLRLPRRRLMLLCDSYPELGYRIMRNLAADLAMKMRSTDLTMRRYQLMLHRRNQ